MNIDIILNIKFFVDDIKVYMILIDVVIEEFWSDGW